MSDIHSDRSWQAMSLITCIMSDISRLLGVGYSETWPQRQSQLISTLQWMRMIDRDTLPEGGFLIPVICPRRALWLNKSLGDVPSWNAQVSFAVTSRHALADLRCNNVKAPRQHATIMDVQHIYSDQQRRLHNRSTEWSNSKGGLSYIIFD